MKKSIVFVLVLLLAVSVVFAASFRSNFVFEELNDSGASGKGFLRISDNKGMFKTRVSLIINDLIDEPGMIYEGWLVDVDSDYKLSLGAFMPRQNGKARFRFTQDIVNPFIYDKVVITKEPLYDINPSPAVAVLAADISDSIGTEVELMAELSPKQESERVKSRGSGEGEFVLDSVNDLLHFEISYEDLEGIETGAHIHGFSVRGEDAGVLFELPTGNPKIGTWDYSANPEYESMIIAGLTYVNVHTDEYPNGEIRGQIEIV